MKLFLERSRSAIGLSVAGLILILCLPFWSRAVGALPPKPNPPRLVNDFAGLLSEDQKVMLEQKLLAFSDSTSNEMAVVTVDDMGGDIIEDYAYDLAKAWGIGKSKNDNGILLLISMQERKFRIEVGSGLEGAVPDIICAQIIRNRMRPAFQQGDYFTGINNATDDLAAASRFEYKADPNEKRSGEESIPVGFIILMILFIILFIYLMSRRRSQYYVSRKGYRDWDNNGGGFFPGGFIGGGGFSGGGGFGGDSGGGFGGFGGGGFSGGGASGDW